MVWSDLFINIAFDCHEPSLLHTHCFLSSDISDVSVPAEVCASSNSESANNASDDQKTTTDNGPQNQNVCTNVNKSDASTTGQSNPFIKSKFTLSDDPFKFNFSIE